jgi:hypothetical protein
VTRRELIALLGYLFPGCGVEGHNPMGQRQLNRLLKLWVVEGGFRVRVSDVPWFPVANQSFIAPDSSMKTVPPIFAGPV